MKELRYGDLNHISQLATEERSNKIHCRIAEGLSHVSSNIQRHGGEQFQGMYSLARGLEIAFAAGAAHYSGWVLGALHCRPLFVLAAALGLLALLVLANLAIAINQEKDWQRKSKLEDRLGCSWLPASLAVGWTVGFAHQVNVAQCA